MELSVSIHCLTHIHKSIFIRFSSSDLASAAAIPMDVTRWSGGENIIIIIIKPNNFLHT